MISNYRLGDLILIGLNEEEEDDLVTEYPNSIGSKFILAKKTNNNLNNIDLITEIVLEHIKQNKDLLPKDISECTLIHLRLGDVIAGNEWHEKLKRPIRKDHIKLFLKNDVNKKYVIGKCFFAKTSSNNYEQCIHYSNIYLQNVLNEINAEHFDSGNADIDLCCAIKSKIFLQGRGFFSKLIIEIRKKLNLEIIETSVIDS